MKKKPTKAAQKEFKEFCEKVKSLALQAHSTGEPVPCPICSAPVDHPLAHLEVLGAIPVKVQRWAAEEDHQSFAV